MIGEDRVRGEECLDTTKVKLSNTMMTQFRFTATGHPGNPLEMTIRVRAAVVILPQRGFTG